MVPFEGEFPAVPEIVKFVKENAGVVLEPLGEEVWRNAGESGTPLAIFFVKRQDVAGRKLAHELGKFVTKQPTKVVAALAMAEDFIDSIGENWGLSGNVRHAPLPL